MEQRCISEIDNRQKQAGRRICMSNVKEMIENGRAVLGIELGSTRIKAVLIDEDHNPIAV